MIIALIVAMDRNGGIGYQGGLSWHLSSDLKRFKSLTMGHSLIMGRKTYESIGRPLPGREMIVISRNAYYRADGCLVMPSLDSALDYARSRNESEVFVIGGGDVFRQALPLADRIYLTRVDAGTTADTHFPRLDGEDWNEREIQHFPPSESDDFGHTFSILERIRPPLTD